MEGDRVDKDKYKEVVVLEKKRLLVQVIVLTALSAAIAGIFLAILLARGAETTTTL